MPAVSKKVQNTKSTILASAEKLFMKYGISKVTIKEIAMEAGISKMTLYRSFSNKEEIACKVIRLIAEKNMEKYQLVMSKPVSFPEKIKAFIFLKSEGAKDFSVDFIKDVYSNKTSIFREEINKLQLQSKELFMKDLRMAQENGELRNDLKLEMIPYLISDMIRKMNDETFLAIFEDLTEATEQMMTHFFNGILPLETQL